jgi:hypothetical protein
LPITSGLLLLPTIQLYRRKVGKDEAEENQDDAESEEIVEFGAWEEVEAGAVRRHFGRERIKVEPVGRVRCEMRKVELAAAEAEMGNVQQV